MFFFLLLDTHFPSEKTDFYWTQHKIQKRPRKNKLRFVVRPKLSMWLFPLLEVVWGHLHPNPSNAYTIARCDTKTSTNAFVQILFSLLGRLGPSGLAQKANPVKKSSTQEHKQLVLWHQHCTQLQSHCPNDAIIAVVAFVLRFERKDDSAA